MAICEIDIDTAYSCSSESEDGTVDTVYWNVCQQPNGWYLSAMVDSDTGHFVESLGMDDGPYDNEHDATVGGINAALQWHTDNETGDLEWDTRLLALYPVGPAWWAE